MTNLNRIIVVGASHGGLAAVCTLVRSLPSNLPATIAIVLHTSAQSPRMLASIVGSCTVLPVAYATDDTTPLAGHIYIAPPALHLVFPCRGLLALDGGPKVRYSRPAADRLFETAAACYGARVIGVVLTGGNSDGTEGLRAIKNAGGTAIVQDPAQAKDPRMPRSALRAIGSDHCMAVERMGPFLTALACEYEPSKGTGVNRHSRDHFR